MLPVQYYINRLNKVLSPPGDNELFSGLPQVALVGEYDTSAEKRDRTLKHTLKANHHNYSVLYGPLPYHNHLPHALGTAYIMGADAPYLQALYDDLGKELSPWADSPHEITKDEWTESLGDKRCQRAYLDFFEDEMVSSSYDWKDVVEDYMCRGDAPLLYGVMGGLGHPLIHLGFAYELNSSEVAMEALALAATCYDLNTFTDPKLAPPLPPPSAFTPAPSSSPLELLELLHNDPRFAQSPFLHPGEGNIPHILSSPTLAPALREYQSAFIIPTNQKLIPLTIADLTKTAVQLLLSTAGKDGEGKYDFFVAHLLTTAWAVRSVITEVPVGMVDSLVRSHWLFVCIVYVAQQRPKIETRVSGGAGKEWDELYRLALAHRGGRPDGAEVADTHYLKVVRTLRESARLWGDGDDFYLTAANKFVQEFVGWGGFAPGEGM